MKRHKDKFNMFAYGLIIVNSLILLSLPAFLLNLFPDWTSDDIQTVNGLYGYKNQEKEFWDNVKGIQTENSELETESMITATATLQPSATIIPSATEILTPIPKISNPKILLLGDSMMLEGFGPEMERSLNKYSNVTVIRKGKYSSGLTKISYYDWFASTESYMKEFKPDIAIVVFGGNDCQDITDIKGQIHRYSPSNQDWVNAYTERVERYVKLLEKYTKYSYWVGHAMSGNSNFRPKLDLLNKIYKSETAKSSKVFYSDPEPRFSPRGVYSPYVADDNGLKQLAKYSDGVHLTPHGGKVMAGLIINQMMDKVELN